MLMYCKIVNEDTKSCDVGLGTDAEYYESLGMTQQEVELGSDGIYYLSGSEKQRTLEETKDAAVSNLWSNYKAFQRKYVDPEDLTLAVVCAANGSEKGNQLQAWVLGLWSAYYEKKDAIASAETKAGIESVDLSAEAYGAPPVTIRELNEEANGGV